MSIKTTLRAIAYTARAINLILIVASTIAVAIIQDQIGDLMPRSTKTLSFQSWMTFFTLLFLYIGLTEIYNESASMLLTPKRYASL